MKTKDFILEGNDRIEAAITNAASVVAEEYFIQNGMSEIADDHDDEWYELQEKLRANLLESSFNTIKKIHK